MGDDMSFGMDLVGALLVFRSGALGWQRWMALVFGDVLFKLALVVLSLMSVGRLYWLGHWFAALIGLWRWCW